MKLSHIRGIIAALALGAAAPADAQDALFNSDVSIELTNPDPASARLEAIKKAEREGLEQLLNKLAPDQTAEFMKNLDDKKLSAMVRGVEVLDEKFAGNRYRAQLRVTYNALPFGNVVQKQASEDGLSKRASDSSSVLIVPVYEESGNEKLWELTNPWRDAWNLTGLEMSGGHIVVPYGDSVDSQHANARSVQTATYSSLAPLLNRYGVSEVVVVKAMYKEENNTPSLTVIRRNISRQTNEVTMLDFPADPQEDKTALINRVARDMAKQIEQARQDSVSRKALAGNTAGRALAVVPYTRLATWTEVQKKLAALNFVNKVELTAISPQQVDMLIHYRGTREALASSIAAAGLKLQEAGNYWVVSYE